MTPPHLLKVVWTLRAKCDVDAIHAWVAGEAPNAADRLKRRLVDATDSLEALPERYRRVGATRELVLVRPYVVRYRVTKQAVVILGVRHAARQRN